MIPIARQFSLPLPCEPSKTDLPENRGSQPALLQEKKSPRFDADETRGSISKLFLKARPKFEQRVDLPKLKRLFSPAARLRFNIRLPQGDMLPEDAPRGIKDEGEGGWLNATLQILESSSKITQWLKESYAPNLSLFGKFFTAYHGKKALNSEPLRVSLCQIFLKGKKGSDPYDLLSYLIDQCPPELKANIRKSVFYSTSLNSDVADLEMKEEESPIINLQLRGTAPHL